MQKAGHRELWRDLAKQEAVQKLCHRILSWKETLREEARGKTKCERISKEEYEKKQYVSEKNIEDVRNMYRTRFRLLPFAGNYANSRKFERTNFLCRCNEVREEEVHLKSADCPVYADIREQFLDLDDDNTLMKYFTMVLARRDELDSVEEDN